jgi:hypothetical protein
MLAKAGNQLRERSYGHEDTFMALAPLGEVRMKTGIVSEVVRDDGAAVGSRVAKMLLVSDSAIALAEGMNHIIAASLERVCQMNIHVFIEVDPDT